MDIQDTIARIHHDTRPWMATTDPSLYVGRAGLILFDYLFQKHGGNAAGAVDFGEAIQQLAEDSIDTTNPLFCGGAAGVRWLFTYLYKEGILEENDWRFLCDPKEPFEETALILLEQGNYDFLHGATGIAHYLLYAMDEGRDAFFREFLRRLYALFGKSTDGRAIPRFSYEKQVPVPGEVNLGLAHGLPSLLLFCVQCCRQDVCAWEAEAIARRLIAYMVDNINTDTRENFFPSIAGKGISDKTSRLGWCYGDLGVAYSLYRAGQVFQDTRLRSLGVDILSKSTHRRTHAQTLVNDACLCHGSAGIAHIYHRLWRDTGLPVFQTACDAWIERTIGYATHPDGIAGYKMYDSPSEGYRNQMGFLEGPVGIGIVLLAYLTGDLGWDHCLMLNS
ncbi:lanthionine synthetase C family protein [Dinghuibacter silviterrae]|uniref:Lanthionine synthetase-like protein n=1 Tax=Dinghuibacter silviterrae TaxID=1539049 RepID=A0A4R8DT29_9BACT|nr:lanthionine synthetase C family protein [Dinghuibacter silviterrae]TDX01420.1 lanthionine synthetase-like protein [Dinghuibacter silviterrae]